MEFAIASIAIESKYMASLGSAVNCPVPSFGHPYVPGVRREAMQNLELWFCLQWHHDQSQKEAKEVWERHDFIIESQPPQIASVAAGIAEP